MEWFSKESWPKKDNYKYLGLPEIRPVPENGIVYLDDVGRGQLMPGSGGMWWGGIGVQCPSCKLNYLHYPRNPKDLIYICGNCKYSFDIYGKQKMSCTAGNL